MNEIDLLFEDFVEKLKEQVNNNSSNAYFIVKQFGIKSNSETLSTLLQVQASFRQTKHDYDRGLLPVTEWREKQNATVAKINLCLSWLKVEELEDGVLDYFKESKVSDSSQPEVDTEGGIDFLSSELIHAESLPNRKKRISIEKIEIDKIIIPENTDTLGIPEKRYEFRRRMMNTQDYLVFGNYGKALDECEFIVKNLELQSAQLYEYLSISYFKTRGGEYGIVQDIENQNEESLKQLALHIFRCRLYNKNRDKTETFEANIEFICHRISCVLRERYLATSFDYVIGGDNPMLRLLIQKYMQTGFYTVTEIYKGNNPSTDFLEYILIELNGGSKLDWLEITPDWQLKNKNNFPALQLRDRIIGILNNKGVFEKCKMGLYQKLAAKYSAIRVPQSGVTLQARKSLMRFFNASIIAYKCFSDVHFLELFREELLHNGKLEWFSLDESGNIPKVVANAECQELGYDPLKDWLRIKPKFDDAKLDDAENALISDLQYQNKMQKIRDAVAQADFRYEKCKNTDRREALTCMRAWVNAYNEIPNEDYINKAITSLIGEKGSLFWFSLDNNAQLINHSECQELNFDAKESLDRWIDHSHQYSQIKDTVWQNVRLRAGEILAEEADKTYRKYSNP